MIFNTCIGCIKQSCIYPNLANRSAETDEQNFSRWDARKSTTVYDLVYNYLLQCAERDKRCKQRNCATSKFQRQHMRRREIRGPTRTNFRDECFDENKRQFKSRADKNALSRRILRSSSKECIADYTRAVRDGTYIKYRYLN